MNQQSAKKQVKNTVHIGNFDKAKGYAKEVLGLAKEKVGSLIGDRKLEAKGHLQNIEGKKDRLKGKIKAALR